MAKSISIHQALALTPTELLTKGYQVPTGTITTFGGTVAPAGWLICDGSSLARADFQALFNAISTAHGASSPTTFNLPDMRGRFARGVSGPTGNDPDAAARTVANIGGNTGNAVGSLQSDALGNHQHPVYADMTTASPSPGSIGFGSVSPGRPTPAAAYGARALNPDTGNVSSETRPKNINLNYIIKY